MNIALDIDGVIFDFVSSFSKVLKEQYNFDLKYSDIYCHDITQVLALPKESVNDLLSETLQRNNFQLIERAYDAINYLNEHHDVYIITGRDEKFRPLTEKLLSKHGIQYKELFFSQYLKKHEIDIEFDLFVEDSVEEAVSLSQRVRQVLVYNHPWNEKSLNIENRFKRVFSWSEILGEVKSYEKSFVNMQL